VRKLEGGEFYSKTLRKIFEDYHNVKIGMYTHGGCFVPGHVDPFTTIGRYCAIARFIRIFNRNHPLAFKSIHGFFFNSKLKFCEEDLVDYLPISIGNDVWVAHNAVILPSVKIIGDGAVVGSGAVVSKDVPPYAIVAGCPARIVRYRFPKEVIRELLTSRWWEKSIDEIKPYFHEFQQPYEKLYLAREAKQRD
jgi:acetyltransferase-like isoleucine patch superfamily enzyme